MRSVIVRRARLCAVAFLVAGILFAADEWLCRLYDHGDPPYVATLIVYFGMPLVVAALPIAALAWLGMAVLGMAATDYWDRGRAAGIAVTYLVFAGIVFSLGGWLRNIYGLDPPYSVFLVGAAMQMVALAMPFVAGAWVSFAAVARLRRRRTTRCT
jgi:hypothetical protein